MTWLGWNTLLFAWKWVFIALIYLALFTVLLAVRREMSLRVGGSRGTAPVAAGRMRVIRSGGESRLRPGTIFNLQPETTLGGDPGSDIALSDPYTSAHHARLRWDGLTWWIEDLGSTNGTWINQERCPAYKPLPIPPGATIRVGDTAFEILE